MNRPLAAIMLAIVLALSLGSCGQKDQSSRQPGTAQAQTTDQSVPQNAGTQFTAMDISGQPQNSSQWIGKVPVVINFWGTWCPPCRREIPDLVKLYDEYHGRGVEMIGLAVKDEPGEVSSFAMKQGMKWVMLMANDEVIQSYDVVNGIPTTIFLDKNGREVTRFIGARSYEDFKPAFEAILQGYQQ
jgi:thiol-disulfide isomerase/thioredoxin